MAKNTGMAEVYSINYDESWFNATFFPFVLTIHETEVYWGGRGSGKSHFVAQKLVLQLTMTEGRNLICIRKQGSDCRNSCFNEIYKALGEMGVIGVWHIRESDLRMTHKVYGNEIIFTGLDEVEDIKSITFKNGNATDVWYEEATQEEKVKTLRDIRDSIRDPHIKCRLILTFNPIVATHWIKEYIEVELAGTDCLIHHSTHRDNKFLSASYHKRLEDYKFTSPYSYQVACLGLWGTTGQTVFNADDVHKRMLELLKIYQKNPPMTISFAYELDNMDRPIMSSCKRYADPSGFTTIYKEPDPKHPYVAAFDTAGFGIDFYACHIMDNITDEQVAVFHHDGNPDACMLQIYGLLTMYNNALVAPEVNFGTYEVEKLREWRYPKIYQREMKGDSYNVNLEQKLGFRTTAANRGSIIANMMEWCTTNMPKINDVDTLNEMLTFTRQPQKNKGVKIEAEPGAHDDLIIAFAILLMSKEQQSCEVQADIKTLEGFWLPEELEMLVKSGRLDRKLASDYKRKNKNAMGGAFSDQKVGRNSNAY